MYRELVENMFYDVYVIMHIKRLLWEPLMSYKNVIKMTTDDAY